MVGEVKTSYPSNFSEQGRHLSRCWLGFLWSVRLRTAHRPGVSAWKFLSLMGQATFLNALVKMLTDWTWDLPS
jgi:hypothetical protein